tara:strand:+ start:354 stop:596 length:243 start_codon:yes stop_codon:yes gene_type:complete
MEKIELDNFLTDGILKEQDFRLKIDELDWSIYKNKKVLIKGCTSVPVPIWSYLIVTARLTGIAKHIYFGEPCSLISIYKN